MNAEGEIFEEETLRREIIELRQGAQEKEEESEFFRE